MVPSVPYVMDVFNASAARYQLPCQTLQMTRRVEAWKIGDVFIERCKRSLEASCSILLFRFQSECLTVYLLRFKLPKAQQGCLSNR